MMSLVQIAIGGAAGALCRHFVGRASLHFLGTGFPYGVLFANIVGSFAMGLVVIWMAERGTLHLAPLITVGFLGGFTTFSAFSLDVVLLAERGEVGLAALYILLSVVLAVGALWVGMIAGRALFA